MAGDCNGKDFRVKIIGFADKEMQKKHSCTVRKKDLVEEGMTAVWKTEKELADCAKKVIYFDEQHELNINFQTLSKGPFCPKMVRVQVKDKLFCATANHEYYGQKDNDENHIATVCS